MALSDPTSVTYAAVARNLALIGRDSNKAEYQIVESGGVKFHLLVEHTFEKRNRCRCVLRRTSIVDDPLRDDANSEVSLSVTFSADWGPLSTPADVQALFLALRTLVTDALFLRIAGGET